MKIYPVTTARAEWYDRNPITRVSSYLATAIAPHGVTQRWSYTVPAGKKFAIQWLQGEQVRDAAAATINTSFVRIRITPSGGAPTEALSTIANQNTIGARSANAIGSVGVLFPSDTITGNTDDNSAGGTNAYAVSTEGVEFDA